MSVLEASKCDWQIKEEVCNPRPQWHQTSFSKPGARGHGFHQRKAVNELAELVFFISYVLLNFIKHIWCFFPLVFLFQLDLVVIESLHNI